MIAVNNLTKVYHTGQGEVTALSGISFNIARGSFVSIVGSSGSGKTTLVNLLGCLDFPTSGSYLLDGIDVFSSSAGELSLIRREKIGFVFQSFDLLPSLTVMENVELPLVYRGVTPAERKVLATRAIESVGLGDRLYHRPMQLSGGQQQRTAIARAIVADPPLLLADEPTGNLDNASAAEVLSILTRLNELGVTIILITHDNSIAGLADKRLRLEKGLLEVEYETHR